MNANQLEAILTRRYGKVKRSGRYLRIPCHTCAAQDRNKMKRHVPVNGMVSHCFICNEHVPVQDLVGDGCMVTFVPKSAAEQAAERIEDPRAAVMPGHSFIPVDQLPEEHPAVQFLFRDQLYDLEAYSANHGICYCPADQGIVLCGKPYVTSAERLIFPVRFEGRLVGWQARAIPGTFFGDRPDGLKYYHVFDKGRRLFNFDAARQNKLVVVVEGVKKALKFGDLGVATFGCGVSTTQLNMLAQHWEDIVVMLDAEDHNGTQKKALEMTQALRMLGRRAINVDLRRYGAVSPDELSSEQLLDITQQEWKQAYDRT